MYVIQFKGVNKVYDDGFQALTDIDLTFNEGEINVLIGPSGCGKTTTMKLVNRLVEHTDGDVLFNNENIESFNPIELRRQMGFVIQNIGLFPHMTIFNNVATVPKLLKWDKERIERRVVELLEMVGLDPEVYRNRYPAELSGGQQQRVGVVRALAAEPAIILMDEPFSALDPITREQLQDDLLNLQENIQKTIIFVTHDMDEALKIADKIILMKDGHIVQQGSPEEILTSPVNEFVEEFIGEDRLREQRQLHSLSLDTYVESGELILAETMGVAEALDEMVSRGVNISPVVDDVGVYRGYVLLSDLVSPEDSTVATVCRQASDLIYEMDSVERIVEKLADFGRFIPVVSEQGHYVGMLNKEKLFIDLYYTEKGKQVN